MAKKKIIISSGKRKRAIARVYIRAGKGRIRINKKAPEVYFNNKYMLNMLNEVIELAGKKVSKVDIDVNVKGGGIMGQIDAIRRGIAVGISNYFDDTKLSDTFYDYDPTLIKNDVRRVEPKKDRRRKARAKYQKSYR